MRYRAFIFSFALVVLAGAGCAAGPRGVTAPADTRSAAEAHGLIVVEPQSAGETIVIGSVSLPGSGYAVVMAGDPDGGTVLGSSAILAPGTTGDVFVRLGRAAESGESLFIVLYGETNGDGVFVPRADRPLRDEDGRVLYASFDVVPAQ
jgi:hypothetical protein